MALSVVPRAAIAAPERKAAAGSTSEKAAPSASLAQGNAASTTPAASPPRGARAATTRSAAARAKPESTPPPAQVKKARDLWYRGVEAFRNGNYEAARIAFAECYRLMPKSDVLRNLSISEIQSGHYVSAARHLTQLLAAGELPSNVRDEATTRLAQAEAQVGQLHIKVDVAGADIHIDGTSIGRSPVEGKWYVEPGQHDVTVSKAGYPVESRQIFALSGVAIPIDVSLEALRREQAADEQAARLMGTREGQATVGPDGREELSTASTVLLVTGGTVAVASLAAAIVFTVSANGHEAEADGVAEYLTGTNACYPGTPLSRDCELVWRERQSARDDQERARIGFVGFGVASAVTLGYALWLALDGTGSEPATTARGLEPSLSIAPGRASISLEAQF